MIGEPSSVLMAAKLPAEARTAVAWSGTSRRAARSASTTRPPPMAIRGASGPSTAPKIKVARAARMTPGNSAGVGARCVLKPSAGCAPPVPGRYLIARPVSTPPTASTGSGHHTGAVVEAQAMGKMGEYFLLEVVDQREEAVGGGGDRHPENRRDDQQSQVSAAAQQRARIGGHGHASIVARASPEWLTCGG